MVLIIVICMKGIMLIQQRSYNKRPLYRLIQRAFYDFVYDIMRVDISLCDRFADTLGCGQADDPALDPCCVDHIDIAALVNIRCEQLIF